MTERRWSGSVQLKAERSLLENNLNQFIKALANEADVNGKMSKFPYSKYSLFEMACKTPGRAKFIAACLQRGAFVGQVSYSCRIDSYLKLYHLLFRSQQALE
uniref:uncharacterized protein LOC125906749 n=1 Tax=Anopheles coluzzii TaxID=1518534 RepID=UPI0020FFB41A|nr:uncharacterized protein LOC125906749 [Anopheles coluzzii]